MFTIRPAQHSDEAALGRYGAALMRQHHAEDPRRFLLTESPEKGYGRFLVSQIPLDDTIVRVAERDGDVVGYVFAGLEPLSWMELRGPCGFIHDVFVDERARRQGVARALLDSALEWIRSQGMTQVVLLSKSKNSGAQTLFAAAGFRPTMVEMTLDFEDAGGK